MTTTIAANDSQLTDRRWSRWGGLAGIAFVVLFVVGFTLALRTPNSDDPDREWIEFMSDSGDRVLQIVGGALIVLSAVAFLWFVAVLTRRVRQAEAGQGTMASIVFGSGVAFVTMLLIAAVTWVTVSASIELGDTPVPDADLPRQLEGIGFGALLLAGALFAALLAGITSLVALRSGTLPRWLAIVGLVVAVLTLASLAFFPFALFLLWVLAVGIVMIARA